MGWAADLDQDRDPECLHQDAAAHGAAAARTAVLAAWCLQVCECSKIALCQHNHHEEQVEQVRKTRDQKEGNGNISTDLRLSQSVHLDIYIRNASSQY